MPYANDCYLCTAVRDDGLDGLYLASSPDGYRWTVVNDDRPVVSAAALDTGRVDDPCLAQGPDGRFHLLWSMGGGPRLGYAWSRDLLHWSPQPELWPMLHEPAAISAAAPALVWDAAQDHWLVLWYSVLRGPHPDIQPDPTWHGLTHRIFAATTRDFQTWSATRVFFDPGYNCIDATIVRVNRTYRLVFRDERWHEPATLALRWAASDRLQGPYTGVSAPITHQHTHAPSAIEIGEYVYIYYEHTSPPPIHHGMVRTRDWEAWEDVTSQLHVPPDLRYRSVLRTTGAVAARLCQAASLTPGHAAER